MSLPPKAFMPLIDVAIRWQAPAVDVVGWAIEGHLAISAPLPLVETEDGKRASGLVEIRGEDAVGLFGRERSPRASAVVRQFRRADGKSWEVIARPNDGVTVGLGEVLILRGEVERFEAKHMLFARSEPHQPNRKRQPGPGAPQKHEWGEFYGAIISRVHNYGLPKSQGKLTREMISWFDTQKQSAPDERTIRRKIPQVRNSIQALKQMP